ncbi:hypothetical protein [Dactylosporangium sp. NPDC051484]|uniref:hypothetical protein n=1 Tax=Dactylosporangium sp. NPDC051484 TaxID=3154942 RepID=UPI00344C8253
MSRDRCLVSGPDRPAGVRAAMNRTISVSTGAAINVKIQLQGSDGRPGAVRMWPIRNGSRTGGGAPHVQIGRDRPRRTVGHRVETIEPTHFTAGYPRFTVERTGLKAGV